MEISKMNQGKKETIQAIFYNLLSKGITYVLLIVFANIYLPEEFGLGIFAFNIRNLIMLFIFVGLPDTLIPFIINNRSIRKIVYLISGITFLAFLIGVFLIYFYPWIWPLVVTLPVFMLNSFSIAFWRAKSRHDIPFKVGFFSIIVVLIFAIILKDYGKLGIVGAYALGNFFSFFITFIPLRKEIISYLKIEKTHRKNVSEYLANGSLVTLIGSILFFISWLNSTLLGFITNNFEKVAAFNVASSIASIIAIIPIVLSMFIITRASQIKDESVSLKILQRAKRISFSSSLISSIMLIIFMPYLVLLFFSKYTELTTHISILIAGMIFFSFYYLKYSYYVAKLKTKKMLPPLLVGLIANFILAFILIAKFGLLGAIWTTTLTHFVIFFFMCLREKMKKILVFSIFSAIIILLIQYLDYYALLLIPLIILLLFLSEMINQQDIKIVKDSLRGQIKKS